MRPWLRRSTNALLGPLGQRVVSAGWGPRGPMDSLRRARALGIVPRQIVDVGASNGSWTRECLQVLPDARYLLVDPLPANASPLTALAAQHSKVRVWQGALGRAPGALALLVHGDQSSFLPSDSFAAQAEHSVEVRTLDSFLGTELLTPPDFIKAELTASDILFARESSPLFANETWC
jgi:FkbM family methyltransferase